MARRPGGRAAVALTWLLRRRPAPAVVPALADPGCVRRVLAVKLHDQLGDFLLVTPALRALRERYPGARLVLLTREFLAPLARRNRQVDEVWVMPRVRGLGDLRRFAVTVLAIAGLRPDLAFVFNSVSRSKTADALAALSGARLIVGRSAVFAGPVPADAPPVPFEAALAAAKGGSDPVYDLDLEVARASDHQVERHLDLVRWTGATISSRRPTLDLAPGEREAGLAALADAADTAPSHPPRPWVGLHPGAANALKCWPLESFVELGVALAGAALEQGRGAWVAVFDSPRERGRAAALCAGLEARGVRAAFIPAGGIERFAGVCAALDLLVCNDSGVMHVAAALEVPTVSFHSLGHPAEWAPRGPHAVSLHAARAIGSIPVPAAIAAAVGLLKSGRA